MIKLFEARFSGKSTSYTHIIRNVGYG